MNYYPLYIKIHVPTADSKKQRQIRNTQYEKMKQAFPDLEFKKPKSFGAGKTMTISQSTDDFRRTDSNGIVNIEKTATYLKKIANKIKQYN